MGCHGNHEISYNQSAFDFEDTVFILHLSGPIKKYNHNGMS